MWIIVDENGRVTESGDGCLMDDRIEVDQPEGWREEYRRNWVLRDGRLEHDPIADETDYKAHVRQMEKLLLMKGE